MLIVRNTITLKETQIKSILTAMVNMIPGPIQVLDIIFKSYTT